MGEFLSKGGRKGEGKRREEKERGEVERGDCNMNFMEGYGNKYFITLQHRYCITDFCIIYITYRLYIYYLRDFF